MHNCSFIKIPPCVGLIEDDNNWKEIHLRQTLTSCLYEITQGSNRHEILLLFISNLTNPQCTVIFKDYKFLNIYKEFSFFSTFLFFSCERSF